MDVIDAEVVADDALGHEPTEDAVGRPLTRGERRKAAARRAAP